MKKVTISALFGLLLIGLLAGCDKQQRKDKQGTNANQITNNQQSNSLSTANTTNNPTDNPTGNSISPDVATSNMGVSYDQEALERGYDLLVNESDTKEMESDCQNIADMITKKAIASEKEISDDIDGIMLDIIKNLGYPVRAPGVYKQLYNYESIEAFIQSAQNHQAGEVILYQVHSGTGFSREKFTYDGTDMYHLQANMTVETNGVSQITSVSYCRIKDWNYTDKGWFTYELCAPQPPEALEVIDSNVMIRVKPMDERYLEIAEKYLLPIGYQGNNLFCSNWDESNLQSLDYNGLYEYLYEMKYHKKLDEEQCSNGIPEEDFTDIMMEYLPVTKEQLKEYASYDAEKNVFLWSRLGCFNYSPSAFGCSIPELISIEECEDGTAELTIDVVCESAREDQVYTHKAKVRWREDGQIEYLGNQILDDRIEMIPEYVYRISAN